MTRLTSVLRGERGQQEFTHGLPIQLQQSHGGDGAVGKVGELRVGNGMQTDDLIFVQHLHELQVASR